MGKLIYSMLTSLDGYTEDEHGRFARADLRSAQSLGGNLVTQQLSMITLAVSYVIASVT
jgi:hypothetical protein